MIEEIIKRFRKKFYIKEDTDTFAGNIASPVIEKFITQELLALQEKTRDETAREILDDVENRFDYSDANVDQIEELKAKYLSKNTKETESK